MTALLASVPQTIPSQPLNTPLPMKNALKTLALATLSTATLLVSAPMGKAVTLDVACAKFAAKLSEAQASGNADQAKTVYSKGSQRIASRFNGATCPNVKAP